MCEKLAYTHHINNGGTLVFRGLVQGGLSDYLICAFDKFNELVGFLSLADNMCDMNDLYVMQIVVSKKHLNQGIASKMIDYAVKCSKGYDCLTADVSKGNIASNALLVSKGFKKDERDLNNFYFLDLNKIENREKIKEKVLAKR